MHFCCNAVVIERDVVLPEGAPKLVAALTDRGYRCHKLPMTEFLKAGRRLQMPDSVFAPARRNLKLDAIRLRD